MESKVANKPKYAESLSATSSTTSLEGGMSPDRKESFTKMMMLDIGESKDQPSALARVYNAIFNSVKEISQHLRYSTSKYNLMLFHNVWFSKSSWY